MGKLDPSFKGTDRKTMTAIAKDANRNGNPQQRDALLKVASGMKDSRKGGKR